MSKADDSRALKYLGLAQTLENRIKHGTWPDGRMPSLRELAQEHEVSVVTISRAVQVLRDKGLIGRTDNSGCYLADPDDRATGHYALCLRVTPGRWQRYAGAILRIGFDAVGAAKEAKFREPFDWDGETPPEVIREQVRKEAAAGLTGIFFLPSRVSAEEGRADEAFLAACDAEQVPVVLIERNLYGRYRPLTRDLVSVDDVDGAVRCTRHLLDLGRKRVGLVVASACSSHDDRVAGYLHALHTAAGTGDLPGERADPLVVYLPRDLPQKTSDRWLADRLLEAGADAVFCYQDSVAVGLIVELLARGVRVPQDMAVAGFENLPIGDLFTVGVTTYAYPAAELVRTGMRVIRQRVEHPNAPPIHSRIRGELIVRESTRGG
jgi:LacI family transcriptional regulator